MSEHLKLSRVLFASITKIENPGRTSRTSNCREGTNHHIIYHLWILIKSKVIKQCKRQQPTAATLIYNYLPTANRTKPESTMQIKGLAQVLMNLSSSTPSPAPIVQVKNIHEIDNRTSRRMRHHKVRNARTKPSKPDRLLMNRDKRHTQNRGVSHMLGDQKRANAGMQIKKHFYDVCI